MLTKISSALGHAVDPFAVIERLLARIILRKKKLFFSSSAMFSLFVLGQESLEDIVKEAPEEEVALEEEEVALEEEVEEEQEEAEKDVEEKKNE